MALTFLTDLPVRFRHGRSTIFKAARSAGGVAYDDDGEHCSPASDEARLLPWERDMYRDAVQKQPQQLAQQRGEGRTLRSRRQVCRRLHCRAVHSLMLIPQTPEPYMILRAHEVLSSPQKVGRVASTWAPTRRAAQF